MPLTSTHPDADAERKPLPHIPVRATVGLEDPLIADDLVTGDLTVSKILHDSAGMVAPGAVALIADSCLGLTAVFQGRGAPSMATSWLHIEFARPIAARTRTLRGTGRLRTINGNLALTEGEVRDDSDSAIAYASMGAVLIQGAPASATAVAHELGGADASSGSSPVANVRDLLGMRVVSSTDSGVEAIFRAAPELANLSGGLHGGVATLMGERTCEVAVGRDARLVALRAAFARPVAADNGAVTWRATSVHRGRRTAHFHAELSDQVGQAAAFLDAVYSLH